MRPRWPSPSPSRSRSCPPRRTWLAGRRSTSAENPEDGAAWTGLGDALYALERYAEAVEAYDRAIAADPNNEEAWNNKGFTFFMLGIHEEALACYEKALAINPRYKQAWYNKG